CSPATGAPRGVREACASDGGVCGGACDGVDPVACVFPADETECRAPSCADGIATAVALCDAAGSCPTEATVDCAPYACDADATACAGDCVAHADCAADNYCEAGVCVPTLVAGTACGESAVCATGFCTDGVCCDSACAGQCEACAEAGSEGECSPVSGEPRVGRAACATDGSACGGSCNGTSVLSCAYPAGDTVCGEARCDSAMLIGEGACDSGGACIDPAATLCETGCADGACLGCEADAECADGEVCSAGVCTPSSSLDGGGCGCAIATREGTPARRGLPLLLALAALGVVTFIRRRPRAS
ncbi:MAG: hypothetical protein EXR73_08385, partial [Myxococcales bacterium]|nr:hypothetical protein [Myxococcales bacterium]